MPIALADLTRRADAVKKFLRDNIAKTDAAYKEVDKKYSTTGGKPLRHPKGVTYGHHDRVYLWNDAIWCGDYEWDLAQRMLEHVFGLSIEEAEELVVGGMAMAPGEPSVMEWMELAFRDAMTEYDAHLAKKISWE